MGGRGGSSGGGGGGTFGGLEINRDDDLKITYKYLARTASGGAVQKEVKARNIREAKQQINKNGTKYNEKTLLPDNFFNRAIEEFRNNKDGSIWNRARDAFKKAMRRESRRLSKG